MAAARERANPGVARRPVKPAEPAAGAATPAQGGGARLAWLDALRGIAALCVVSDHLGHHLLQPVRHLVCLWFNPGWDGVCVFFLVSGYIVPASLERKGSVRTFWVSRLFRLYPLYLFALLTAFLLWGTSMGSLDGQTTTRSPQRSATR
jgi:peptidoglycan/LPS O-acetylase OafA/YrhL